MRDAIGFIGLGAMGGPMAANLLKKGHALCVFDRDPAKVERLVRAGAQTAGSPAEVARAVRIVFTMLPDFAAVRAVMTGTGGLVEAGRADLLVVNTSTVGPRWAIELAGIARSAKLHLLEACVTPGSNAAEAGTLNVFTAGAQDDLERVRPLLEAMGRRILYLGEYGRANALKMVNNSLSLSITALIAEAVAMGERAGLPGAQLLDILSATSADSYQLRIKLPRMIDGDYSPGGTIDLAIKDLSVALEYAAELGAEMPLATRAREAYAKASANGIGPLDCSGLIGEYRATRA